MTTITFDTLSLTKKLKASGFLSTQAEALAEAMQNIFETNLNEYLFTKQDAKLLESKIYTRMAYLKNELIVWMIGIIFAQTALLTALKFF